MRSAKIRLHEAAAPPCEPTDAPPTHPDKLREAELRKHGAEFRADLVERWAHGRLSNIDLCTIAYNHTRSGGYGTEDLGVNPLAKGGNHSRKCRKALGLEEARMGVNFLLGISEWPLALACYHKSQPPPLQY